MSAHGRGVRSRWRPAKRFRPGSSAATDDMDLEDFFREALTLHRSPLTFDMDSERQALAEAVWNVSDLLHDGSLAAENVELTAVLLTLMRNTNELTETMEHRNAFRVEGLLTNLQRAQSQKQMPLLTARLSIAGYRAHLPRTMWQAISLFAPGLLASHQWTEEFLEFAREFRPVCPYKELAGVAGVMFDNYTRKVLYASQVTVEAHGYRLDMTNSASMRIPELVAPPNFDANRICTRHSPVHQACVSVARLHLSPLSSGLHPFQSISMADFTRHFLRTNVEVRDRKRNRFTEFLRATAAGTLFERPSVQPPYVAYLEYHPPMWNVLQSSYEDVEAELNVLRNRHLDKKILFVGGDGLSIMRINHLLKMHPDLYLDSAPMVIPIQGEAPHGVFHMLHGGWRLFRRFIRCAADATLGPNIGRSVVDEPTVKVFNTQIFALFWMMRACSEYLLHISATPGGVDINLVPEFISACERNIDLAWVVHFLYDFAYLVLDCKQCVRANKSKSIDTLWKEFYAIGHSDTAHKTHYVPMAIMRIFWAEALVPELADLYHSLRAIPLSSHVFVGWDTPIEFLNGSITEAVHTQVSEQKIERHILNYSLLSSNYGALLDLIEVAHPGRANMRELDSNVNRMKDWLISNIGADWATATQANQNSKLGIGRGVPPWEEMEQMMTRQGVDSVPAHVSRVVRELTSSFYTFS